MKTDRSVKARRGSNPLSSSIFIIAGWSSLAARWAHNPKVDGSNPSPAIFNNKVPWCSGYHACLSRRRSRVRFPSGPFILCGCSLVVKLQPSKLLSRVRFSSPALNLYWPVGQAVKTPPFHGGNTGSSPVRVIPSTLTSAFFVF